MAWGALLLLLFLAVGWRSRRSATAPMFPTLLATTLLLVLVYVNLGKL